MADYMKNAGMNIVTGLITIALTILGAVLFFLSYTTGYYTFGQMNSTLITAVICCALIAECASLVAMQKFPDKLWAKFITFFTTGLLAAAAILILGDRVEGIGNCIVTDYDSGHGGEEAIYMSVVGACTLLLAVMFNCIGAFFSDGTKPVSHSKKVGFFSSAVILGLVSVLSATALTGVLKTGGTAGGGTAGGSAGTYAVALNQENGNVGEDVCPDYQFLSTDLGMLCRMDSRFTIDVTLTLDDAGAYSIVSDAYVIEAGKRAEIGDPSGLGIVCRTTSEGTYVTNDDGTVTTSPAEHVKFELHTDTYSAQMKDLMALDLNGSSDDGDYDSAEYPVLLDYVPETTWTLEPGTIVTWGTGGGGAGEYKITFSQENGNVEDMPDYQFLSADLGMLCRMDSRFYIDVTLKTDGAGGYTIISDAYVLEAGKRAEIGDPSGLGIVCITTGEGTYADNGDGTITTSPATHGTFKIESDTYSAQMKDLMAIDMGGSNADGEYDSNDFPVILDYFPETVWTVSGSEITTYAKAEDAAGGSTGATAEAAAEEEPADAAASGASGFEVSSDDGATKMIFGADGTYTFVFEQYGIEDAGTYTFADGVLTLVDANGKETTAEGDPLKLHYTYSQSDQLTGDFTIDAAQFAGGSDEASEAEASETEGSSEGSGAAGLEVASDDGATKMIFGADGTYTFVFEQYGIEDAGTYTFADGVLTLTDANGKETTAEGDPLKLHYEYSQSNQLTGDFTIPLADLG